MAAAGGDVWVETRDEETGAVYFFNAVTAEAVWSRPEAGLVVSEAAFDALDADGVELAVLVQRAAALAAGGGGAAAPGDAFAAEDAHVVAAAAAPAGGAAPEWEEVVDDDTGERFWFNTRTQESQWEDPSGGAAAAAPPPVAPGGERAVVSTPEPEFVAPPPADAFSPPATALAAAAVVVEPAEAAGGNTPTSPRGAPAAAAIVVAEPALLPPAVPPSTAPSRAMAAAALAAHASADGATAVVPPPSAPPHAAAAVAAAAHTAVGDDGATAVVPPPAAPHAAPGAHGGGADAVVAAPAATGAAAPGAAQGAPPVPPPSARLSTAVPLAGEAAAVGDGAAARLTSPGPSKRGLGADVASGGAAPAGGSPPPAAFRGVQALGPPPAKPAAVGGSPTSASAVVAAGAAAAAGTPPPPSVTPIAGSSRSLAAKPALVSGGPPVPPKAPSVGGGLAGPPPPLLAGPPPLPLAGPPPPPAAALSITSTSRAASGAAPVVASAALALEVDDGVASVAVEEEVPEICVDAPVAAVAGGGGAMPRPKVAVRRASNAAMLLAKTATAESGTRGVCGGGGGDGAYARRACVAGLPRVSSPEKLVGAPAAAPMAVSGGAARPGVVSTTRPALLPPAVLPSRMAAPAGAPAGAGARGPPPAPLSLTAAAAGSSPLTPLKLPSPHVVAVGGTPDAGPLGATPAAAPLPAPVAPPPPPSASPSAHPVPPPSAHPVPPPAPPPGRPDSRVRVLSDEPMSLRSSPGIASGSRRDSNTSFMSGDSNVADDLSTLSDAASPAVRPMLKKPNGAANGGRAVSDSVAIAMARDGGSEYSEQAQEAKGSRDREDQGKKITNVRSLQSRLEHATSELQVAHSRIHELVHENSSLRRQLIELRRSVAAAASATVKEAGAAGAAGATSRRESTTAGGGGGRPPVDESFVTQLSFLKSVPLFHTFSEAQFSKMCAQLRLIEYHDGETIIRQGDVGDKFYIIKSGKVRVHKMKAVATRAGAGSGSVAAGADEDGDDEDVAFPGDLVAELSKGFFFGERALLTNDPRAASCVANGEVFCFTLDRAAFKDILGSVEDILGSYSDAHYSVVNPEVISITHHIGHFCDFLLEAPGAAVEAGAVGGTALWEMPPAAAASSAVQLLLPEFGIDDIFSNLQVTFAKYCLVQTTLLFMCDHARNTLVLTDVEKGVDTVYPVSVGGLGAATLRAGEVIFVPDTSADERFAVDERGNPVGDWAATQRQIDTALGRSTRSIVSVPVRNRGGTILAVLQVTRACRYAFSYAAVCTSD